MSKERKKAKQKQAETIVPKQRPVVKKKTAKSKPVKETEEEPKEPKSNYKFVKLCDGYKPEEAKQIIERVQKGEVSFAYYGVDGNKGCRYFFVNKKV